MLRILSYVGIGVTPSGPPRRLRPVQVVSLLDTVSLILLAELCWWRLFVLMCFVHNIT